MTKRTFRIAQGQSPMARGIQSLMIADLELGGLVYRGPYQLADTEQRDALLHTLNTEFDTTIDLPKTPPPRRKRQGVDDQVGSLIVYLVIIDGKPELFYEDDDVPSTVYGFIRGRLGIEAARRVTFRSGMLPPAEVPAS